MSVRATVTCSRLAAGDLEDLVRELTLDLSRLPGMAAAPETVPAPTGARSDAITLGTIVMTLITSGAAVAAINVIKTYFEREPLLKVKFKAPDGTELELEAKQLNTAQTDRALQILKRSVDPKR